MALSMEQLDTQTVDLLPAREVMSSCGGGSGCNPCGGWGGTQVEDSFNYTDKSFNVGDVLSNNLNGIRVLSPSASSY